jgi:homoserine kinase type II
MAVYTELTQDEIQTLLNDYDLPKLAAADGIRSGVENTNYKLTLQDGTKRILTLFEKRVAEADLPFFAGLMEQLAAKHVPCPMPVHARDGAALRRVKNKPAMMVTFLEGASTSSIQNPHMTELGRHLANMHLGAAGFPLARPNALSLSGWQTLCAKILPRADEIVAGLADVLHEEIQYQEAAWPAHLASGVIHADLFPDNVFFDKDAKLTGLIDFYFACNDMLAYDIAICMNAWCFEKGRDFNITRAKLLLRGYNDVRPLPEAELAALPVLARGASLRFLLTRAHDWLFPVAGALVTPHDPLEYLRKLRFHRTVKHHSEYGL